MQMLKSLASAANVDRSIIEHTPHYCLIDCDEFNFIHVHFGRVPRRLFDPQQAGKGKKESEAIHPRVSAKAKKRASGEPRPFKDN